MTHPPTPPGRFPTPPPPRKRDAQSTREKLVRAALDLFTSQGYHETTTPQIARRAGIAEGTIYRHFSSKEQLLNEIYRAAARLFIQSIKDTSPTAPCRERLETIAKSWRTIAHYNPNAARLVFQSQIKPLLDPRSRETENELKSEIEKIIAAGKASGQVRVGSAETWAAVWLRVIALMLERTADKTWPPDQPASQNAIDAAWLAIAANQTTASAAPTTPPPP
ncbi:HTH-type transcriptional repressor KstR2 [bacterium HR33]|nr:HTH-type transcriptional repressor KstR2 [bacterium HR33]